MIDILEELEEMTTTNSSDTREPEVEPRPDSMIDALTALHLPFIHIKVFLVNIIHN